MLKEVGEAEVRREPPISFTCSLPQKWRQSSLLPAPPQPAWDAGFTHQSSSVSARRPQWYSTPMCSLVLSESSLAPDPGHRPVALLGVGLDVGLPFVTPPDKRRGRAHFHPLLCLYEASRLGHPFSKTKDAC